MSKKRTALPNNIWDKERFLMCGYGEKCKIIAMLKHIWKCLRWSKQRATRGYADCDKWNMFEFLQTLIPDMLQDLRENHMGAPTYLGENYFDEDGAMVNDTCNEEWNKILDHMIFLWRESREETCTQKNPYEEEHRKFGREFREKYGVLGEKLQTEAELGENQKRGGGGTIHFMDELPEYKDISDRYFAERKRLEEYRSKCKDEALDLLKEHFYALWD